MSSMRTAILVTFLGAGLVAGSPTPTSAQHCETIECYTAECFWVGPGHRRCRRVCRRRCWREPRSDRSQERAYAYAHERATNPVPVPKPSAAVPKVAPHDSRPDILFYGIVGLASVLAFACMAFILAEFEAASATKKTDHDTAATDALRKELEAAARRADAHIAAFRDRHHGGSHG